VSAVFFVSHDIKLTDRLSDEILKHLGKGLMDVKVDKDLIDWDLDIIEKAALQAVDRETDSDDESTDSDA
jgi:protein SHQ1